MRPRSARVRFEDFFSPADFAHVNWMAGNARSILSRGGAIDDVRHQCSDCERGRGNCRACAEGADSATHFDGPAVKAWHMDDPKSEVDRFASALLETESSEGDISGHANRVFRALRSDGAGEPMDRGGVQGAALDRRQGPSTLEFVPERDQPVVAPLVQRKRDGRVDFKPGYDAYVGEPERGRPWRGYPVNEGTIKADDGRTVRARRNLSDDRRLDTNCHGFAFAGGEVWINNDEVDGLLEGDCYRQIDEAAARQGDIVIYRGPWCINHKLHKGTSGVPNHSGVLQGRDANGKWWVKGKRGNESAWPVSTPLEAQWTAQDQCGVPPTVEFWRKFNDCQRR